MSSKAFQRRIDLDNAITAAGYFKEIFGTQYPRLVNELSGWFDEMTAIQELYPREPPTENVATWLIRGEKVMSETLKVLNDARNKLLADYRVARESLLLVDSINLVEESMGTDNAWRRAIWRLHDIQYNLLGCARSFQQDVEMGYIQILHDPIYMAELNEQRKDRPYSSRQRIQTQRNTAIESCRVLDEMRARN